MVLQDKNNIYIPTAFSPNGDQVNDFFTIYSNGQVEEISTLQIFDRWGGLQYQEKNITPNNPLIGWDGTSDGQKLQPGVYVYQVWLTMKNGEEELKAGEVVLIR